MLALLGALTLAPHEVTARPLVSGFAPGVPILVEIRIPLEEGWHSYWVNPGDNGAAPKVAWSLPSGWRAGGLRFPVPEVISSAGMTSYGYEKECLLVAELTPPARYADTTLRGRLDYMVCREACVPKSAEFTVTVRPGADAPKLGEAYPVWAGPTPTVRREGKKLVLERPWPADRAAPTNPYFFATDPALLEHAVSQPATVTNGVLRQELTLSPYAPADPKRLNGIWVAAEPWPDAPSRGLRVGLDL